jgi:FKBP-type peptidyl-prolyl cis-trans isomerase
MFFMVLPFTACNKDDKETDIWREANEADYRKISVNPAYQELKTASGPSGIFYKVIKSGTGDEFPLQTSSVKVLYKGSYYNETVFDAGSSKNEIPVEFLLTGNYCIRGFSFALQNMVIGDKWEIYIPYNLGYGSTSSSTMKAYSNLIFELELVEINQYPN